MPAGLDITIPDKPVASPLRANSVRVPHPAGTNDPVNENPRTVDPPAETVKPAPAASQGPDLHQCSVINVSDLGWKQLGNPDFLYKN